MNNAIASKTIKERTAAAVSLGNELPEQALRHTSLTAVLLNAANCFSDRGITFILRDKNRRLIRYDELLNSAKALLTGLRKQGLKTGDKVLLQLEQNDRLTELFWACQLGGMVPIPLPNPPTYLEPHQNLLRLKHAWMLLDNPSVITDSASAGPLRRAANGFLEIPALSILTSDELDGGPCSQEIHLPGTDDPALILLTSGSSGEPKAVILSHRAIITRAFARAQCFNFSEHDISLNWLPLDHVASLVMFHLSDTCLGCTQINIATSLVLEDPLFWPEMVHHYQASVSWAPNFAFKLVADHCSSHPNQAWNLSSMRCLFNGGEPVNRHTAEHFLSELGRYGLPAECLFPDWGMSELASGIVYARPLVHQDVCSPFVEVGRPIPGTSLRIVDQNDRPLAEGEIGRVQAGGCTVMLGYYGRPEETRNSFTADGWLKTGDLGMLVDGCLSITGREKDLIIINGVNYAPLEIESVISQAGLDIDAVAACGVRKSEDVTDRLILFISLQEPSMKNAPAMINRVRTHLLKCLGLNPDCIIPMALETMPRTSIGKIRKAALQSAFMAGEFDDIIKQYKQPVFSHSEALISEQAGEILAIFRKAINNEQFGANDNFFQFGGDSLRAAQVLAHLNARFGLQITITQLFETPTANSLSVNLAGFRPSCPIPNTPLADGDTAPLAPTQRGLWALQTLHRESAAYNVYAACEIRGALDTKILEESLQHVVNCHTALRTRIILQDNVPRQFIDPQLIIKLAPQPVSEIPDSPLETVISRHVKLLLQQPFDLSLGPLFRAQLLRLAKERHVLVLCLHHIICDGRSLELISAELWDNYETLSSGKSISHLPPVLQYSCYAFWKNSPEQITRSNTALAYWQQQFRTLPEPLALIGSRPAQQGFRGDILYFNVDENLVRSLRCLAKQHHCTEFMAYLALFNVLLCRYSGQESIVVGTPAAGRQHDETQSAIGFFVNTLAIQTLLPHGSFIDVLAAVKNQLLEAMENQLPSLEQIVATLGIKPDASVSPLFQAMIIFNQPGAARAPQGLSFTPLNLHNGTAKFELSLNIVVTGDHVQCSLEYSTDRFSGDFIAQLSRHFLRIAEAATTDTDSSWKQWSLLDKEENEQLLIRFNATQADFPDQALLDERVLSQARTNGRTDAIAYDGMTQTYSELLHAAEQFASRILACGLPPQSVVAICIERCLTLPAVMLGILRAGCIYLPLDTQWPAARLSYMLEDSGAKLLVADGSTPAALFNGALPIIPIEAWQTDATENLSSLPPLTRTADDIAYILYTSGSTGTPKGVRIRHRSLLNFLDSMAKTPGISKGDRLLSVTTISFDIFVLELFLPLLNQATCILAGSSIIRDGRALANLIEAENIAMMQATPMTWRMLIEAGWKGNKNLKVLCGGEALTVDLANTLCAVAGEVWNLYGPTETTVWSSVSRIKVPLDHVTLGRPIQNTQVYVLDANLQPVPKCVTGEIYIGGEGLAEGYHGKPELTASRFVSSAFLADPMLAQNSRRRLYKTGDLACFNGQGELEYLGRSDNQVKINGYRIELCEIEEVLKSHSQVQQAVVKTQTLPNGITQLIAFVKLANDGYITAAQLKAFLTPILPKYMVPGQIIMVSAIPTSLNGKIDRDALLLPTIPLAKIIDPRKHKTILEKAMLDLWCKILNSNALNWDSDFFESGGNSLLAVTLMIEIEKLNGRSLSAAEIFQHSTPAAMAEYLESNKQEKMPMAGTIGMPAVFLIPPAGSTNLAYLHMARLLGENFAVYALEYPGLKATEIPLTTIESLATYFVGEIRKIQPLGPYRLIGRCFGGLVAYEITRQLSLENIANPIVLIDTSLHTYGPMSPRTESINRGLHSPGHVILQAADHLLGKSDIFRKIFRNNYKIFRNNFKNSALMDTTGRTGFINRTFSIRLALRRLLLSWNPQGRRLRRVWETNLQAVRYYRPTPSNAKLNFIMNGMQQHNTNEIRVWEALSTSKISYFAIDNSNHATLHHPQFADKIAAQITKCFIEII